MVRKLIMIALVLAMASSLAACGRKGKLEQPPDTTYPKTYPSK